MVDELREVQLGYGEGGEWGRGGGGWGGRLQHCAIAPFPTISQRHLVLFTLPPTPQERTVDLERGAWAGSLTIPAGTLPALPDPARTFVYNAFHIHGTGHGRQYLAAHAVPGDAPDFHQPGLFPPLELAL